MLNKTKSILIMSTVITFYSIGFSQSLFVNSEQKLGESSSWSVSLNDLDGDNDGDLDVIACTENSDCIWYNNGTDNLTNSGKSLGGWGQCKYYIGDVDGNNFTDIVVSIPHAPSPEMNDNINDKIWFNDGKGNFSDPGLWLAGSNSIAVDLGNIDGDGKLDIFAVNMVFDMLTGPPYYIARGRYAEVWLNTTPTTSAENGETIIQNRFQLYQNYLNPFNPSTTINFQLSTFGKVELIIYNALGQKVKTLIDSFQNAGVHSTIWNGMDDSNNQVSSGTYFYSLSTNEINLQKKMILIR